MGQAADNQNATPAPSGSAARLVQPVLRVPLLLKLLGANLLIVAAAIVEQRLFPGSSALLRSGSVLLLSFVATALLVWLALRPITMLEATAERVSAGDYSARVELSAVADRDVQQLAVTMNRLLDRVAADRARIQYLAGRSVRARDIERESVARELRDSLAQMVSGIALQISAIRRGKIDAATDRQLETTRQLVEDLTDQMRGVAEALYPGTISEFGLANALRALGRVVARRSNIVIEVDAEAHGVPLSPAASGALYRVAEEALRNVTQHSQAARAHMKLSSDAASVTLEIVDDGRGVDITTYDPFQAGLGLFSARAVLTLAGGDLQISGAPGRGTRVTARIPHTSLSQGPWRPTS
jgi:signal transduction histidine kinase